MKNIEISVIIPVFNSREGLRNTLDSLLKLSFPRERFEIIVADNNSTDGTIEIAESFKKDHPQLAKIVREDSIQSSYATRNKGIDSSEGDIIVFTDADMTVPADWLDKIYSFIKANNAEYMGFDVKIISPENENIFQKYNRLTGFPMQKYLEYKHFVGTGCLAVQRGIFKKVGYFQPKLVSGGDNEFGNRVYNAGIKQYFDSSIIIKHPARRTFRSLLKKALKTGRGKAQLSKCGTKLHDIPIGLKEEYPRIPLIGRLLNFKKKVRGWEDLSLAHKFFFLIMEICFFSAGSAGYVIEYLKISGLEQADQS